MLKPASNEENSVLYRFHQANILCKYLRRKAINQCTNLNVTASATSIYMVKSHIKINDLHTREIEI